MAKKTAEGVQEPARMRQEGPQNYATLALYAVGALVAYQLLKPAPIAGHPSAPGLLDRLKQLLTGGAAPAKSVAPVKPPSASVLVGPAPAPVPTQGGVTFRSGNVAGFIPIPFEQIASGLLTGLASIFAPSRDQTRIDTAPPGTEEPSPTQPLASQDPAGEVVSGDGTFDTPPDYGQAGQQWYQTGASEAPAAASPVAPSLATRAEEVSGYGYEGASSPGESAASSVGAGGSGGESPEIPVIDIPGIRSG